MPAYEALLCDGRTDDVLGSLPLTALSFREELNGPGAATMEIPLNTDAIEALTPLQHSVFVLRDGVPVWGGVLWVTGLSVGSNSAKLSCSGFWSLVRRRRLSSTLTYTDTDQVLVAKDIIDTLQAEAGGNMLIDTSGVVSTGVDISQTYPGHELQNAGDAIQTIATRNNGFDFAVSVANENGHLVRRLVTTFPTTGRATDIILEDGVNIEALDVSIDGTGMLSTAHIRGKGSGASALLYSGTNPDMVGVYPKTEGLVTLSSVDDLGRLQEHSDLLLTNGARPIVMPTVVVAGQQPRHAHPNVSPTVGSFAAGDLLELRSQYGLLDISDQFRITSWACSVDKTGSETLTMNLAPKEAFNV